MSYSKNETERKYKKIDLVPVTKSMAKKLQTCSPYSQTYVDSLFTQFWTNTKGYKYYFKIKGKKGDHCKIETYAKVFWLKTESKETYEIPIGLAEYSGNLLYEYANIGQDTEAYKQFCKCAQKLYSSASGSFLELTEYWRDWDKNSINERIAYHENEKKNDEYTCKQWQTKINKFVKTSDFINSQTNKEKIRKVSYELDNNRPKTLKQNGFGYSEEQPEWSTEFWTDYSRCKIKFNDSGVTEYNFEIRPIDSNWEKFRIPKCW